MDESQAKEREREAVRALRAYLPDAPQRTLTRAIKSDSLSRMNGLITVEGKEDRRHQILLQWYLVYSLSAASIYGIIRRYDKERA